MNAATEIASAPTLADFHASLDAAHEARIAAVAPRATWERLTRKLGCGVFSDRQIWRAGFTLAEVEAMRRADLIRETARPGAGTVHETVTYRVFF